jgi:hypothetical protein
MPRFSSTSSLWLAAVALVATACTCGASITTDGGTARDGGASNDAGSPDAAGGIDAGQEDGGNTDSGATFDAGLTSSPFFGMDTLGQDLGAMPYPQIYGASRNRGPGLLRLWDTGTAWPTTFRNSQGTIVLVHGSAVVSGTGTAFGAKDIGATLAFPDGEVLIASVDAGVAILSSAWTGATFDGGETYRAYGWAYLDQLFDAAKTRGAQVLYVWWLIPGVYTGQADPLCHGGGGTGTCFPPQDLHELAPCQGSLSGTSTTDCEVKVYTTDLLRHLVRRGTPPAFVELGNEVNLCSADFVADGGTCPAQSHVSQNDAEWCGTISDFYTLSADVASIVRAESSAVLIGPGVTVMGDCAAGNSGPDWLGQWLALDGGKLVDAIGFHGYLGASPEAFDACLVNYRAFLDSMGAVLVPIADTEFSWSGTVQSPLNGAAVNKAVRDAGLSTLTLASDAMPTNLMLTPDADLAVLGVPLASFNGPTFTVASTDDATFTLSYAQPGAPNAEVSGSGPTGWGTAVLASMLPFERDFTARSLLIQFGRGAQLAVWYGGTSNFIGTLCDAWTDAGCTSLRPAGTAWGEVASWLSGATAVSPCTADGTVWSCDFKLPSGAAARAVWDTDGGAAYAPPSGTTTYRDLSGNVVDLDGGGAISLTSSPILFE